MQSDCSFIDVRGIHCGTVEAFKSCCHAAIGSVMAEEPRRALCREAAPPLPLRRNAAEPPLHRRAPAPCCSVAAMVPQLGSIDGRRRGC